jgi:hypothetical protein
MPFDGNGVYALPTNSFAQPVADTTISNTDAAATWADFVTAFSTCVTNDGQTINPVITNPQINALTTSGDFHIITGNAASYIQLMATSGIAVFEATASGTNSSYSIYKNATTGELARVTADNTKGYEISTDAGSTSALKIDGSTNVVDVPSGITTDAITATTTNADLVLDGNGTGIVTTDSLAATTTNGDLSLAGNGTGIVTTDSLAATTTNGDLTLAGNGTGNVTINSQRTYGTVFLDTPALLLSASGNVTTWTQLDMSAVYAQAATDVAVAAIISIRAAGAATGTAGSYAIHVQKNGLGGSADNSTMRCIALGPANTNAANDHSSTIVTLDSNSDFEYQLVATNFTPSGAFIYLLGYYV